MSYSWWVWNPATKLSCNVSGKWNVGRISLQKLDVRVIMFKLKSKGALVA